MAFKIACAALVGALCAPAVADARQRGAGWPCGGTVDATYIRVAEATGGKVLLLKPSETGGAAAAMAASGGHDAAVFRAGGELPEGAYEFDVAVDSTIESAYFFLSLQCLQEASVIRPSGEQVDATTGDADIHRFDAVRMFVVRKPAPGTWKIRLTGRGVYSVVVKANTTLRLRRAAFYDGLARLRGEPPAGKRLLLETETDGSLNDIAFSFVAPSGAAVERLTLVATGEPNAGQTYGGEVTVPDVPFRIALSGVDANGFRVQRMWEPLFQSGR